jgi:hypothetical protein
VPTLLVEGGVTRVEPKGASKSIEGLGTWQPAKPTTNSTKATDHFMDCFLSTKELACDAIVRGRTREIVEKK